MTDSNRREFLIATAAVGGGMALALYLQEGRAEDQTVGTRVNSRPWLPPAEGGVEINPWIVIGPDDRVLIRVNQSELGQGVLTSNPMMICEELECDWAKVQAVYADPNRHIRQNRAYDHLHTEASSSVRLGRVLYQQAGASARERLKTAAAQQWGVPVAEVTTKDGVLTHNPTGRRLRYGEVAAKAATIRLDKEPPIKTPDQYTLIGTRVRRFDVEVKSRAQAVYGIDVRLPGMVYAATKTVPHLWWIAQGLRFRIDPEPARRHNRSADGGSRRGEWNRGGCRYVVAREDRARCDAGRVEPGTEREPGF
jgi:isoquinoline 1-oxidoreductase subunit beta